MFALLFPQLKIRRQQVQNMVTVKEALDTYTIGMAHCLRAQIFFNNLKKSSKTKSLALSTDKARKDFFSGKVTQKSLRFKFGEAMVKKCLEKSMDHCLHLSEERTTTDLCVTTGDSCVVCMERGANYYIIHGSSAHKCVCAVCAMGIALRPNPKCPITREDAWLMVESAKESYGCVCLKEKCPLLLVIERQMGNKSNTFRAIECHMCSLESFHATFCRIFSLYY